MSNKKYNSNKNHLESFTTRAVTVIINGESRIYVRRTTPCVFKTITRCKRVFMLIARSYVSGPACQREAVSKYRAELPGNSVQPDVVGFYDLVEKNVERKPY